MGVERLSTNALNRLINGNHENSATCVVKFYSNECHFCHALKDVYLNVSQNYSNAGLHFFAFNVDDIPGDALNKLMGREDVINGVPSILVVKTGEPRSRRVNTLPDPDRPDSETFYTEREISDFIEQRIR
jgi:thiol-disulfide isomerase/thioredoxin